MSAMKPASRLRAMGEMRILVVDADGTQRNHPASALPTLLRAGDLVVVNDAATLPASLAAKTSCGEPIELRLASALDTGPTNGRVRFTAALLGAGDYQTRTEDRPLPPRVSPGDILTVGPALVARVLSLSPISRRLLDIELSLPDDSAASPLEPAAGSPKPVALSLLLAALYAHGTPIQYAHVPSPLPLWDVQNPWAGRPWAVEMASAGRALRVETLVAMRKRGIEVAFITHAAGLSATGDDAIDASLPLPERFEVGEDAARAVARTKARGGRVIAIGTSVVRALESAARLSNDGSVVRSSGITSLLMSPDMPRLAVDAVLTGVHESDTTHFTLLGAFSRRRHLDAALSCAVRDGLLGHELGDFWLVWGERAGATAFVAPRERVTSWWASCAAGVRAWSATFAA